MARRLGKDFWWLNRERTHLSICPGIPHLGRRQQMAWTYVLSIILPGFECWCAYWTGVLGLLGYPQWPNWSCHPSGPPDTESQLIYQPCQSETSYCKSRWRVEETTGRFVLPPSTSPASLYIDYQRLYLISVKYLYPLPLVLAALEHLHSAEVFTELDLHSAYNLACLLQGDDLKTVFSKKSGH